jgi:hypothetical protein
MCLVEWNENCFSSASFGLQEELSDDPSVKQELNVKSGEQDGR